MCKKDKLLYQCSEKHEYIIKARIKKTNKIIYLCAECDTVLPNFPYFHNGVAFSCFSECPNKWEDLEILEDEDYCKTVYIDKDIKNLEYIKAIFKKYKDGIYNIDELSQTLKYKPYPNELDLKYFDLLNDLDKIRYLPDEYEQIVKLSKRFDCLVEDYCRNFKKHYKNN